MSEQLLALNKVQRRVAAIGFFAVTVHGVIGLIGAAHVLMGQDRHSDAMILVLMSGVIAIGITIVVRAILGTRIWSPAWTIVALTPTALALFLVV